MIDILVSGLLLSGTYALVAMGLNLQYGVARIMNLANGEFFRKLADIQSSSDSVGQAV